MAALTDVQKKKIHDIIYEAGKQYIPVQELNTVATWICDTPTEATVQKAQDHLMSFPYMRLGQTQMLPTGTQKGLAENDIRIGLSQIRQYLNLYPWS